MGQNRHLTVAELDSRYAGLWNDPRPMTPEQMLHVMFDEHVVMTNDGSSSEEKLTQALRGGLPARMTVFSDTGAGDWYGSNPAELCARIDGVLPEGEEGGDPEMELAELFVRLCRSVYPERELISPDRAMLDRMIDFACRNGVSAISTPERFWLAIKTTIISFDRIFSPHRRKVEWRPSADFSPQPSIYTGNGLREEFWEYVVLGGELLKAKEQITEV